MVQIECIDERVWCIKYFIMGFNQSYINLIILNQCLIFFGIYYAFNHT